ncbi:MAG: SIMPL domain-containing protein [Cyanosarcina radialis HA8281-LM2]|jgi:hypothetical protein|nr:SIMPL domain-containing protein [Cyanosarcina radialis HA8281-LM2]
MKPNIVVPRKWSRWQAVALGVGLASLSASLAFAQERVPSPPTTGVPFRTLTVTGQGKENIPATIAQVRLGVEVQGKTATDVQEEAAKRSSAVVTLLRSRNVEKLQTTGIGLNPNYSYENNRQRLIGYTATNTVSFQLDAAKVGTLLDESVKAGATRIDSISFIAADPAIAAAQKQALREATDDAQQQADAVLATLNLTRKDVVSIQINGAASPPPPPVPLAQFSRTDKVAAEAVTPAVAGEQEVNASVTLQISY